jgi:hypothetical protein
MIDGLGMLCIKSASGMVSPSLRYFLHRYLRHHIYMPLPRMDTAQLTLERRQKEELTGVD